MDDEVVEKDATGKRLQFTGNKFEKSRLAAGVWPEHGNDFAGLGLETKRLESKNRSLRRIRRVCVAYLLDAETHVRISVWAIRSGQRAARAGAHASLRRSK